MTDFYTWMRTHDRPTQRYLMSMTRDDRQECGRQCLHDGCTEPRTRRRNLEAAIDAYCEGRMDQKPTRHHHYCSRHAPLPEATAVLPAMQSLGIIYMT